MGLIGVLRKSSENVRAQRPLKVSGGYPEGKPREHRQLGCNRAAITLEVRMKVPDQLDVALRSSPSLDQVVSRVQPPSAPPTTTCVIVDNVLDAGECARFMEIAEQSQYTPALVNVGGGVQQLHEEVRRSGRVIIDSHGAVQKLWDRMRHAIPARLPANPTMWTVVGLNERLRFLKYEPGDYFAPHFDGNFTYEDGPRKGDTSFMTVLLYLNEPQLGGETSIMIGGHHVQVTPRCGSALIFDHDLLHQGEVLHEGTKVVVRTDVMFRRSPSKTPRLGNDVGLEDLLQAGESLTDQDAKQTSSATRQWNEPYGKLGVFFRLALARGAKQKSTSLRMSGAG